jgi:hypothetical protein
VPKVPKKRKVKSGKERTGKGNLADPEHRRQRMRTQMIDGNSQSDVTAQDLEQLSRAPKRRKTEVGHCQKVCQDGAKLQGTTAVAFWVSKFVPALTSRGWNTANKPLPRNWSDREIAYTELQATLGKEGIRQIRMRQGVSSGSDEQVGFSSQSSVTQTNEDKDEMEDVVGGEENVEVEDEEEVVRDDDDQEEVEEDVLDEKEEEEGEEDEDEDGEKVEDEVLEEGEQVGEEEEEESDVVRELLSKHSVWLGL